MGQGGVNELGYILRPARNSEVTKIIEFKNASILEGEENISKDERVRIESFIERHVPEQLAMYKVVEVAGWVRKGNVRARDLYELLGFCIEDEDETRYRMRWAVK